MNLSNFFTTALIALTSFTAVQTHAQQDYPNKPITIVVAYASGGQGDTFARVVGEKLSVALKQPVVVDNKPGVSGTIGTRFAMQAKNDGYTLFLGQTGEMVVNRVLMKDLGYDPVKDFVPVALIGESPLVLLAPLEAPYKNLAEFIAAARAKPNEFSYGSVGAGTPGHLSAEALRHGAKFQMTHIPYKGVGPLMTDLMAGRLQAFFSSASAALPQVKGGKLKAIAVTSAQRMAALPNVPTVAESLAGFNMTLWGGLFAPVGTPKAVVDLLNKEVNTVLNLPEIKSRFESDSVAMQRLSATEFSGFVSAQAQKYERLIKDTNIKLEQ